VSGLVDPNITGQEREEWLIRHGRKVLKGRVEGLSGFVYRLGMRSV